MDVDARKKRRKKILLIIIIVVVAVLAIFYFAFIRPAVKAAQEQANTPLATTVLQKTDLEQTVAATGTFEGAVSRSVVSTDSYKVTQIFVSEGEKVGEGQTLATLDTTDIDEDIAAVLQDIAKAQNEDAIARERAQGHLDKTVLDSLEGKADYDQVITAQRALDDANRKDSSEALRDQLKELEKQKDDCTITAPITGTVTAVNTEVGLPANGLGSGSTGSNAATSMFVVQDLSQLQVPASVAEYDAVLLSPGLTARITSDTFDGQSWTGTVKAISPVATDENNNFTVTVTLEGDALGLTSGMSAKIEIITESKKGIYAVPYDAVVEKEDGSKVVYALPEGSSPFGGMGGGQKAKSGFSISIGKSGDSSGTVSDDGRVEIPVTTGMETDYLVEISGEGLTDGLQILTDPLGLSVSGSSDMMGGMMIGGPVGGGGAPGGGGGVRVERSVNVG
ncbi:MAG: efflux RND transporter periplasmic adaptor subunit [Clostridiales Family XIII bacterium]|jgi:RND family efflux transporter MFP subunit|nr:efflux RND transporter periplasmic adaptor subunit [Clostridiales Family XIII bacterium]